MPMQPPMPRSVRLFKTFVSEALWLLAILGLIALFLFIASWFTVFPSIGLIWLLGLI